MALTQTSAAQTLGFWQSPDSPAVDSLEALSRQQTLTSVQSESSACWFDCIALCRNRVAVGDFAGWGGQPMVQRLSMAVIGVKPSTDRPLVCSLGSITCLLHVSMSVCVTVCPSTYLFLLICPSLQSALPSSHRRRLRRGGASQPIRSFIMFHTCRPSTVRATRAKEKILPRRRVHSLSHLLSSGIASRWSLDTFKTPNPPPPLCSHPPFQSPGGRTKGTLDRGSDRDRGRAS